MKLAEIQFETEQDRDKAALAIIAIRERIPEPETKTKRKPTLMIWETERREFEQQMRQQSIPCHVDHETEISDLEFVDA